MDIEWVSRIELRSGDIVYPDYHCSGTNKPAKITGAPTRTTDPLTATEVYKYPATAGSRTGAITIGSFGFIARAKKERR